MDRRFDLFAVSLLMFTIVFTVWLGVSGPVLVGLGPLKDWQPLMAAFVALGAASLAYRASMARVNFDRATAIETERRKRIGLVVRAIYAVFLISREAVVNRLIIRSVEKHRRKFSLSEVPVPSTGGLQEAWTNFEYFTPEIVFEVSDIQTRIRNVEMMMGKDPTKTWEFTPGEEFPAQLGALAYYYDDVESACERALFQLREFNATLGASSSAPRGEPSDSTGSGVPSPRRTD
jgi:hypothetical protein